ncbi:unnamed protein product [Prorocentrum cordatum]|uniref:Uncharacterized protein n=1 Tax=Prorocentrum cordatum TaxID=2364126 RepID=A0ABN9XSX9_9DINO|nr:unnamed protein product [Polarella glacialis]
MAVFLLVSLSSYMRRNELMGLRRRSSIAPAAGISQIWSLLLFPVGAGQAGQDRRQRRHHRDGFAAPPVLGAHLRALASGPSEGAVWTFTCPQYLQEFKVSLVELGTTKVIVPCQTRHSGPSIDIARRYRTVSEARRRGQWASVKSAQRCAKGARLGQSWELLPASLRRLLEACEGALEDILLGRPHGVALPWRGTSEVAASSTSTQAPEVTRGQRSSRVATLTRTIEPVGPRRT